MSEERPKASHGEPPPMPIWVKVFGAVALAVVVLFVIVLLVGSGHGPSRHGMGALPLHIDL